MNDDIIIKTENLGRDYGHFRALDNLDLQIERGRFIALLGPNGAGKTTFLNLITGRLEPTRGEARVLGRPCREIAQHIPGQGLISNRIACMPDRSDPPGWATLRRLVDLQADVSDRFDRSYATDFYKKRNLKLSNTFGSLSKGQRRWVLAGLTLSSGAELLLLDEPADGLDPSARRELYDRIRDYINEHDATALVATHIIGDIERVVDEVAILEHGRLVLHADLDDLKEQLKEIEMPLDADVPQFADNTTLIGSKEEAGVRRLWVLSTVADPQSLQGMVGSRGQIRPVSLETLYLALTEHKALDDKSLSNTLCPAADNVAEKCEE